MKTQDLEFDEHNNRIHWIDDRNIEWKSVYNYSGKSVDVCIYWAKFPAGLFKTMPEGGIREWPVEFKCNKD